MVLPLHVGQVVIVTPSVTVTQVAALDEHVSHSTIVVYETLSELLGDGVTEDIIAIGGGFTGTVLF